jgi:hypothetical protein
MRLILQTWIDHGCFVIDELRGKRSEVRPPFAASAKVLCTAGEAIPIPDAVTIGVHELFGQ